MVIELIKGVALLLALSLLQSFVARRWRRGEILGQVVCGVLFGGICVVGMAAPVELRPGIIFDARSAILAMSGLFGGPVTGALAATIAAAYRLWIGGSGTFVGLVVIVTSVVLGLLYRLVRERGWVGIGMVQLLIFGFVLHVASAAWFLLLPADIVGRIMSTVVPPFVATFTLGTAILGLLLLDIERRIAIEGALADSETRFRQLYNHSPVMMHSIDGSGVLVDVNEHWLKTLGYERSEVIGRKSADFLTAESRKYAIEQVLPDFFETGVCKDISYQFVRKSGETVDVLLTATSAFEADGRIERSLAVLVDVTERNRIEELLRQKNEELDHYFASSLDLLCIADTDGYFHRLNAQWEKTLGYDLSELIGKPFLDFVHPDDRERTVEAVVNLSEQEEVSNFVNRYRCKDGTYRSLEWNSYPSGSTIYAVARDISRRQAAIDALKESEERFYQALENIPDVVVIYNRDLRIRFINEATRKITGLPTSHFLGKRDDEVWPSEVYEAYLPVLEGTFATGEVHVVEPEIDLGEGNVRQLKITCVPIRDEKGLVREVVGITHDHTEQRKMEGSLRQAQKMEAIGQLTSGIAHDFNNALTAISVNAGLLERTIGEEAPEFRHLREIAKSVERSAALTRKLLNFSRTEVEGARRVSANEFILGMQGLIAKSLTPAIQVELSLAEEPWLIEIDPGDLEDALLNLSLNARDAMPDGGTLIIETANKVLDGKYVQLNPGSAVGEHVMITVSDTGTGMAQEIVEKVFDPFFTTKEVGKGTGLGLSMVYAFVQRSGGHVKIYSESGEGTTIHLYFPRSVGPEDRVTEETSDPYDLPRGDEKILVVDDEEELVEGAVSILEEQGYRVLSASSGREALAVLRENPSIDLLFSDVVMPGTLDGYRLAVEALKIDPEMKVLLTSGFTRKREEFANGQREIVSRLAKTVLHKPYSVEELVVTVRRILDDASPLED